MDSSRISFGEKVAGIAAAALFVFMLVPWYGATSTVKGGVVPRNNVNAWQSFSITDILLFLVIVVTVALVLARAADSIPPNLPAPAGLIIAVAGGIAVLLILFRLIKTPGEEVITFMPNEQVSRKIGVFLGLIAAAAISFGGYTAMNERAEDTVKS